MSDYLPDTPYLATQVCPTCEPDVDPSVAIIETRYCADHELLRSGTDDALVTTFSYLSGSADAGGEDNRRWCEALHRR
jgi:hypothetical protein